MTVRNLRRVRRSLAAAAAIALVVLAGCGPENDQNSLRPGGPSAQKIFNLYWPIVVVATVIFLIVAGILLYAIYRFRERPDNQNPKQVHGNAALEIGWTVVPAVVLAFIAVFTVATVFDLAKDPVGAMEVRAVGKQWWWQFQYTNVAGGAVVTSTELHIPVDVPVVVNSTACDLGTPPQNCNVVHSFWVPELAGKADAVPGRDHELKIEADEAGVYLGQCAEYCGLSHANMHFRVIAESQEDFDAWLADQQAPPATPLDETRAEVPVQLTAGEISAAKKAVEQADADPTDDIEASDVQKDIAEAKAGDTVEVGVGYLIQTRYGCTGCHSFEPDKSNYGPNLTHFGSRGTFAGGSYESTQPNVSDWVFDAPSMIPMRSAECRFPPPATCVGMPSFSNPDDAPPGQPVMTRAEADAIAEYLRSQQ